MKKTISAAMAGALLLGLLGGCSGGSPAGSDPATVEAVSAITGGGAAGLADWYAGMVVSGETAEVKRDSGKTVLEIYVEEGDMVRAGAPLFCYDSEKMQLDLDMLYLDKENYANTIAAANAEIKELENQRSKAKDADKLSYTLQIDSRKADIREAEYNSSVNDRKITSLEASLENAEVVSPIAGRVMSVNEEGTTDNYGYYDPDAEDTADTGVEFITVTDVTSMRIQGTINELNAYALSEGMAMRIRSRMYPDQTWTGTLSLIDWENPVKNTNETSYYISDSSSDEMTTASKYPFYVDLESTDGLMLGQHVYIEPDTGDGDEKPAGPMLPGYYIAYEDNGDPYVWADDGGKLEKRSVTLGGYDADTDCYEVTDGLAPADYIAFPAEGLAEGQSTERYDPSAAAEEEPGPAAEAEAMP